MRRKNQRTSGRLIEKNLIDVLWDEVKRGVGMTPWFLAWTTRWMMAAFSERGRV